MKLLLITSTYPAPHRPQQGVFNENLVKALRKNHEVRVIAPIAWTEKHPNRFNAVDGVMHPTFYYPPRILRSTYGWWYWFSIQAAVRKLIESYRPDRILGYWAHPDCAAAGRVARKLSVPMVAMVGGSDIRLLAKSWLRGRAIKASLERADRVIAFSQDLASHVEALGIGKDRIDVLYRGVDPEVFCQGSRQMAREQLQLDSNAIVALWVGRLVDVKNPMMAISALPYWKQLFGDRLKLVMIGEGMLRSKLQQMAANLDVANHCLFLGNMPQCELANWYRAANLTILTSISEGIPNVLLESIACNTPFVATDVGGVREIADAEIDGMVPSMDDQAFRSAVAEHLTAENNRTRSATRRDVHQLAEQLIAVLERL